MSINRFFDKTVTQKRKASQTSHTVEAWANISTTLKCCIPPTSPGDALAFRSLGIKFTITHNMFCWATEDIKVDDKMVNSLDEYIVRLQPKKWGNFYQVYLSEVS